jgi:hypothetical protein
MHKPQTESVLSRAPPVRPNGLRVARADPGLDPGDARGARVRARLDVVIRGAIDLASTKAHHSSTNVRNREGMTL